MERKGRIVTRVVADVTAKTLLPLIEDHVLPASSVYTDEMPSYTKLPKRGYRHRRVHHTAKIYVDGDVHTNIIDGFWMLLKTGIMGTHHAVSGKYLHAYANEYAFRYNHRDDATPMFQTMMAQVEKA